MFWILLLCIGGLFTGATIGFFTAALCDSAKRGDEMIRE